jgi:hypothetical protein
MPIVNNLGCFVYIATVSSGTSTLFYFILDFASWLAIILIILLLYIITPLDTLKNYCVNKRVLRFFFFFLIIKVMLS